MVDKELTTENIQTAIGNLKEYGLGQILDSVDGDEAHCILRSFGQ